MRCLCCDKSIALDPDSAVLIPHEAVLFQANGTYGSRVFDVPSTVQVFVCDDCFVARLDRMVGAEEFVTRTMVYYAARHALDGGPPMPGIPE